MHLAAGSGLYGQSSAEENLRRHWSGGTFDYSHNFVLLYTHFDGSVSKR